MKSIGCFLLIYVAAVARTMSSDSPGVVDLSAVAVVLAVRWCSPVLAAVLAFLSGFLADGLSSGSIGAHAAANVAIVAVLMRCGYSPTAWSLRGWITAVLSLIVGSTATMGLSQIGPLFRSQDWEQLAISQSATALASATFVGIAICARRVFLGVPCATR